MMKTIRYILSAICSAVFPIAGICATVLDKVQPSFWWAGMKNPELQILLHGNQIGSSDVSLTSKDITINRVVRPENANYLILYVNTATAAPQKFTIELKQKGKTTKVPYELKQRTAQSHQTWDAHDVVYLLMPDRFCDGNPRNNVVKGLLEQDCNPQNPDARHGGDIAGIRQHLDYFSDLGVTMLWITPLLINDMPDFSYHGYAITDYYQIDPRYGSNEEYRDLVAAAHNKGLKVMQDMVFNHCGSKNFLFTDRPDDSWFNNNSRYVQTTYRTASVSDPHVSQSDMALAQDGWFVESMPDFNQRNPDVMNYLIQNSIFWIEYAGIDGIRQDTYPYADRQAMARWCKEIDAQYPGFNIVGETWINNNVGVSYWQKDSKLAGSDNSELPTVMDFPLMALLNQVCDQETNVWDSGMARIYDYLTQDIVFADPMHLMIFLENHDTDRFNSTPEKAQNFKRYRQALTLLLTLRGIPQVYYGTEVAMSGNKSKGDGTLRQDFPIRVFDATKRTPLEQEYYDFTHRLLQWRKTSEAIGQGKLIHFPPRDGVYVYSRIHNGQVVTVLINGMDEPREVDLTPFSQVLPAKSAYDLVHEKEVRLDGTVHLDGRDEMILDFSPIQNR